MCRARKVEDQLGAGVVLRSALPTHSEVDTCMEVLARQVVSACIHPSSSEYMYTTIRTMQVS